MFTGVSSRFSLPELEPAGSLASALLFASRVSNTEDISSSRPAGAEPRALRVWLVDDDEVLRGLFADLLSHQPGIGPIRQFGSPEAILSTLGDERPPNVVLLDINLGDKNGLDAIQPIRKAAPSVKVLMWTMFANNRYEADAFKAGAAGFLLKSYEPREIAELIHEAYRNPSTPRLFPHLASRRGAGMRLAPEQPALPPTGRAGRSHWLKALRELWNPRRQAAP